MVQPPRAFSGFALRFKRESELVSKSHAKGWMIRIAPVDQYQVFTLRGAMKRNAVTSSSTMPNVRIMKIQPASESHLNQEPSNASMTTTMVRITITTAVQEKIKAVVHQTMKRSTEKYT